MDKMNNVNFVSIFDNLNPHAKPMDSSTKNGMDTETDLEVHQKNGEEEQKWMESIQKNSSSVQSKPPYYFQQSREMSTRNEASNNKRLLEVKGKDYQPCIWCVNYSSRLLERQKRIVQNLTKERQIPFFSRSTWECDSKTRFMAVWKLLGNECLDLFMPVDARSGNQVPNNISTEKNNNETMQKLQSYSELIETLKNDLKFREFCKLTDEWLIDQENREYFNKTYGITYIHPLLVDHSGMVVLFLDDREIMFTWSEMEYGMRILGINKVEGLANYLYHPEKICVVMKDGKLVPEVELERRVEEKMAKEK